MSSDILQLGVDVFLHLLLLRQFPSEMLAGILHNLVQHISLRYIAFCTFDVDAFRHFGTHDWTTHIVLRQYVPYSVGGARGDPVHQRVIPRRRFVRPNVCD